MHTKLNILAAVALALSCGAASAITVTTVQTSPGLFTNKTGVCTVDFNSTASLTGCTGVSYSASTPAHLVSGSVGGQYAQPAGDATQYLTVGGNLGDPITITLAVGANYFGFYAGSIDSYNSIVFTGTSGSVTLNGNSPFLAGSLANGSQAGYFNVFTDTLFTSITLSSSSPAFETDNHSFGIASPVPEPESIALMGIGLVALAAAKRRRAK